MTFVIPTWVVNCRMILDTGISFKEVFVGSTEGIIIVDEKGKILIANPAAEKTFHYEVGELTGMQLESLLPARYRNGHHQSREKYNEAPSPRRMGVGRDLRALRKDGSEFPIEISLSHTSVNGKIYVMAFIIDITKRKKTEDALKQSEEQLIVYATELERKVESRTRALNESIQKLEQEILERKKAEDEVRKSLERERELSELKTKFVSIASHEFRTPLSTILSSVSLIHQYKERGEADKQDKHVARIKSSVNHLTGILNDFLSLGKLEEGKIDVVLEEVDLTLFLQEVAEEIRHTLKHAQHLEIAEPGATRVRIDCRMMRNILFNLLSNASKYSEEGKTIWLTCTLANQHMRMVIRDEGMGIPDVDKRHLLERFFRASNVTNIQGTGLGLHIVKRYLDLLNGSMTFTSQEGIGSTFIIELPV
jgi:PAS domain S-box-containing protein